MSQPKVAALKPAVMELKAGKHAWCTCGESANQPFCDGSHKGTDFKPLLFDTAETKMVALCQCKQTSNGPFCDGSHSSI